MRFRHRGHSPIVDPSAYVAPTAVLCGDVRVGPGCAISFGAVLSAEDGSIELGRVCIVMENAVIKATEKAPVRIGSHVLVGPRAYLTGCTVQDDVFLATRSCVFNHAVVGTRSEVRINGTVHLRTRLPADATVPIGWVAVGDPAGSPSTKEAGALTKVSLPMRDVPNSQFAPLQVAAEKGYFRHAAIDIEFTYKTETDGAALVGSGELPFSLVSGEQVLLARAQGLPVQYVAAWYQEYPVSVVANSKAEVLIPQDIKGKKIGLPGLFGANYVGLLAMLYAPDMTEKDVTLDAVGFNQVELLASGQQDIVVGYTANEPIQLRARGIPVTEMRVSDYVQLASNGILSSEKVVRENPELVRAFVRAFLKGLADTIANPQEAYQLSASHIPNFADLDKDLQMQILETSIEQWKADRLGYSDPQAWENMQNHDVEGI